MSATITMSAPPRSLQQRMDALERANRIRTGRARLKKDVKAGRKSVLDVLATPAEVTETMKVFELLLAMPKVGRVKADKILRRAGVSPSKTVGGITDRQRRELAALLGGKIR